VVFLHARMKTGMRIGECIDKRSSIPDATLAPHFCLESEIIISLAYTNCLFLTRIAMTDEFWILKALVYRSVIIKEIGTIDPGRDQ
jgi:hypothetical protein